MVNKVGDIALLLAIAAVFYLYQTVEFSTIFLLTSYKTATTTFSLWGINMSGISVVTFLLFLGAVGKSAQLGLHT